MKKVTLFFLLVLALIGCRETTEPLPTVMAESIKEQISGLRSPEVVKGLLRFEDKSHLEELVEGLNSISASFRDTVDYDLIETYDITDENRHLFTNNPVLELFENGLGSYSSLRDKIESSDLDYVSFQSVIDRLHTGQLVLNTFMEANGQSEAAYVEQVVFDETLQSLFNDKSEIIIGNDIYKIIDRHRMISIPNLNFEVLDKVNAMLRAKTVQGQGNQRGGLDLNAPSEINTEGDELLAFIGAGDDVDLYLLTPHGSIISPPGETDDGPLNCTASFNHFSFDTDDRWIVNFDDQSIISTEYRNASRYSISYSWNFGNNETSTDENPQNINYLKSQHTTGIVQVTLKITIRDLTSSNQEVCTSTSRRNIVVGTLPCCKADSRDKDKDFHLPDGRRLRVKLSFTSLPWYRSLVSKAKLEKKRKFLGITYWTKSFSDCANCVELNTYGRVHREAEPNQFNGYQCGESEPFDFWETGSWEAKLKYEWWDTNLRIAKGAIISNYLVIFRGNQYETQLTIHDETCN